MEAVLTNGVDCFGRRIFLKKCESIYICIEYLMKLMTNIFCFYEKKRRVGVN